MAHVKTQAEEIADFLNENLHTTKNPSVAVLISHEAGAGNSTVDSFTNTTIEQHVCMIKQLLKVLSEMVQEQNDGKWVSSRLQEIEVIRGILDGDLS